MSYQQILTAVDDIKPQEKTIKLSLLLSRSENTAVTLLHTIKKLPSFSFYQSSIAFGELESRYRKVLEEKLDYIVKVQDLDWDIKIDYQSMKSKLKKYNKELKPDLIIIKKGRAAKSLLQTLPCDLLILANKKPDKPAKKRKNEKI